MVIGSFVVVTIAIVVAWRAARYSGLGIVVRLFVHACLYGVAAGMVWWPAGTAAVPQIDVATRLSLTSTFVWSLATWLLDRWRPDGSRLVLVSAAVLTGSLFYFNAVGAVWVSDGVCLPPARYQAEIPGVADSTCELGKR